MKSIKKLILNGVILLEPNNELNPCQSNLTYSGDSFSDLIGKKVNFTEDRVFSLNKAEIQGLHYQVKNTQGALITVLRGEIYCVAVDVMRNSIFLGHWVGAVLSQSNNSQLWIPEGYARGWLSLSDETLIYCKYTENCLEEYQRCISYDDPYLKIKWPVLPFEYPIAFGYNVSDNNGTCKNLNNSELLEIKNA